jgi:molybdenum cofactor cytidylyltransferase
MPAQTAVSGNSGIRTPTRPRIPVAAIVLAAGRSARMGPERNKLIEPIGGRPLIAWPIDALLEAGVDPVLVVTGFEPDRVQSALGERPCRFVHHEAWPEGMGSTLACGMRELRTLLPQPDAVLVCVGDLPGLRAAHVARVLEAARDAGDEAAGILPTTLVVPTSGARRGHPVLFGSSYFEALALLSGDEGARSILEQNNRLVRTVEVDTPAILEDIDTPAELEASRSHPHPKADEKR